MTLCMAHGVCFSEDGRREDGFWYCYVSYRESSQRLEGEARSSFVEDLP